MCYDVLTTSSEDDGVKERSPRAQKMPGRKGKRGRRERERESSRWQPHRRQSIRGAALGAHWE
jgi:hypothetical protein